MILHFLPLTNHSIYMDVGRKNSNGYVRIRLSAIQNLLAMVPLVSMLIKVNLVIVGFWQVMNNSAFNLI